MQQLDTLTIPSFLTTETSRRFFAQGYNNFCQELIRHEQNARPEIKKHDRDVVSLEGSYTFRESGMQVSNYKCIMLYFEQYEGVSYLCRRTFKNEIRHVSWLRRNIFSISDTIEVFDGTLKVGERVYSEGFSKEAQYLSPTHFIDTLGIIHIDDILKHDAMFLMHIADDVDNDKLEGYRKEHINRVQYHKDGVMLTTVHTSFALSETRNFEEEYSQRLSCIDWDKPMDFNPRIAEICRAKKDLQSGEFDAAGDRYTSMEEAYAYWSNAYKEYIKGKQKGL